MRLLHGFAVSAACLGIYTASGCRTARSSAAPKIPQPETIVSSTPVAERQPVSSALTSEDVHTSPTEIQPVSGVTLSEVATDPGIYSDPSTDQSDVLSLSFLISEVLTRNPSMQAAQAAWHAAIERYPQAVSLDDPMFQSMFAPASFASNQNSQSSYYLGFAQRVPWHGKLQLKGQIAQWDATASSWDAEEVKLRLTTAARLAYFDYYLVHRELDLNDKNFEVLRDFRSAAKSRYEANQVSQQDLSAADLELAKLQRQRLELEQSRHIAIARINTLLHQRPDAELPGPVRTLKVSVELPEAPALRELALKNRPELCALAARIQSEQNAVALACKDYYPDFEFMARYDAFWTDKQQRPQVGMNMNVPVRRDRLSAAVREAEFRVTKLNAEYAQLSDSINEQVEIAFARAESNRKSAVLYETSILPSAEINLETARAAYVSGSIDFLRLMDARRQFIEEQIGYQRTLTEFHRSFSDVESAVGTRLSVN